MDSMNGESLRSSLKEKKEAFVTGHGGSSPWEVFCVCLAAPLGLMAYRTLRPYLSTSTIQQRYPKVLQVLLEASVVWFPLVLCQTNYLYPYGVLALILLGNLSIFEPKTKSRHVSPQRRQLNYLTAYRSSIMMLTFVAILAVDFRVFPRRFCKTEVAGFGLMDVGAASFCLSAGLVSRRAKYSNTNTNSASGWNFKVIAHTLPLVVLGILRILTNKSLEYQEHVSEYGVHWNFFFTMGVLALVPPIIRPFLGSRLTWYAPACAMFIYQWVLESSWFSSTILGWSYSVQEYIEVAPRSCSDPEASDLCHVFQANREGILGCIGYVSLFLFGEYVGYDYIWNYRQAERMATGNNDWALVKLAVVLWILLAVGTLGAGLPVSRRSTNAAFCVWAAAHNVSLLALLKWAVPNDADDGQPRAENLIIPPVWAAINRHGLLMFLIANLLTGLVNLTVPTLDVEDLPALGIVFVYISTVGLASLLLDVIWTRVFGGHRKRKQAHDKLEKSN